MSNDLKWQILENIPKKNGYEHLYCQCRCVCGTERAVRYASIVAGESLHCGCLGKGSKGRKGQVSKLLKQSVSQVAAMIGVHNQTIYGWFRTRGAEGALAEIRSRMTASQRKALL